MKPISPKTVSFSGDVLVRMKNEKSVSEDVLAHLKKVAEEHLNEPTLAVTERVARAISNDPHDYASIGTYWWPNPDTPDGLPYVRRDGEGSPMASDTVTYRRMTTAAFELALAAFYFDDARYAQRAVGILYDWHLNPETYMKPHAEYAQSIPGICNGRGIGIIDFSMSSYMVFDAVAILEYLGAISDEYVEGLKKWYCEFTDWCLTSKNGIEEDTELNNHGTYYDVSILAAAIFTGRDALAKKIASTAYVRRFVDQIEPDGTQPLELARTMAMVYSLSNLRALILIANMASSIGYKEYLSFDEKYGDVAIKKAIDFLYPYILNMESFPYTEFKPDIVAPPMKARLLWLADRFGGEYAKKAEKVSDKPLIDMAIPTV